MLIHVFILIANIDSLVAHEAVRTQRGQLCAVTHPGRVEVASDMIVIPLENPDLVERFWVRGLTTSPRLGPMSWGIIDGAYNICAYSEFLGANISGVCWPLETRLIQTRALEKGRADWEAQRQLDEYIEAHGRDYSVLTRYLFALDTEVNGHRENCNLSFDLAYTAANDVTLIVCREGRLHWWEYNKPEHEDWVEYPEIESAMVGHFRIMQAADDMYLIDSEGTVFSSPANGHQRLGSITGWTDVREGERLVILEDQQQNKIAIVAVADETISVLPFAGDQGAAEDFASEITSPELTAGLLRMDEILDEEEAR